MEKKNSKVDKIIKEIDEYLSSMSEEERLNFFIKMGFRMSEEEKSIINEPEKYLREASISGKTFNPGTLHVEKKIIDPDKEINANHDLATIQEAINKCQVAAEQKSAANPTIYSDNDAQTQDKITNGDIAFAERIVRELDKNLSKMSEEEREKFFKECGLVYEKIPNQKEGRHRQLIRLRAALTALHVLSQKQIEQSEKDGITYGRK